MPLTPAAGARGQALLASEGCDGVEARGHPGRVQAEDNAHRAGKAEGHRERGGGGEQSGGSLQQSGLRPLDQRRHRDLYPGSLYTRGATGAATGWARRAQPVQPAQRATMVSVP